MTTMPVAAWAVRLVMPLERAVKEDRAMMKPTRASSWTGGGGG
jgi:hypothetical protein